MKRRFIFLLAFVALFVIPLSSVAEQPATIKFRNAEWGSDPEQFIECMKNSGITCEYKLDFSKDSTWASPDGLIPNEQYYPVSLFHVYYESAKGENVCEVAGYKVGQLSAYFLAGIDHENNRISENPDDALFIFAGYSVWSGDQEKEETLGEARSNMIKELNSLYGDYVMGEKIDAGEDTYCWIAKDNTVVSMHTRSIGHAWSIHLRYEKEAKEHAEKLIKISMETDIGDVEGL